MGTYIFKGGKPLDPPQSGLPKDEIGITYDVRLINLVATMVTFLDPNLTHGLSNR